MESRCNCCNGIVEHIRQHYDPDGLTKPDEDPAEVLEIFRRCFPSGECDLDLEDVEKYLDALKTEREEARQAEE